MTAASLAQRTLTARLAGCDFQRAVAAPAEVVQSAQNRRNRAQIGNRESQERSDARLGVGRTVTLELHDIAVRPADIPSACPYPPLLRSMDTPLG